MRAVVDCGLKEAPDGGSFFDCRRLDEGEQIGDRGFEVQGARFERVSEVRNAYGFVMLAMVKAIEIEDRKMDAAEIAGGSVDRQCSSSERLQNAVHGIQNGATGMERPDADGTAASEGAGAATVKGGLAAMPVAETRAAGGEGTAWSVVRRGVGAAAGSRHWVPLPLILMFPGLRSLQRYDLQVFENKRLAAMCLENH